jgi:hypothetical protein
MQVNLSLANPTSLLPLSTPTFKEIDKNVNNVEDARVVVFLVNHNQPSHQKIIVQKIHELNPNTQDILLVEDPETIDGWTFPGIKECWENPELLEKISQEKKIYVSMIQIVERLTDPVLSIDLKLRAMKNIKILESRQQLGAPLNRTEEMSNMEIIKLWLSNYADHVEDIEKAQCLYKKSAEDLYADYLFRTVDKTFPVRQMHLIEKIIKSLPYRKIFVICGNHHGNEKTSCYPLAAKNFTLFLKSETQFFMYGL